jgi:serine protease Do
LVVEQSSGPAAKAGVEPGDIILALNSTPVKSVNELRTMVQKAGKVAALLVQRNDAKIFIPVELG